jgi:PAS domain S-box-containing protein
VSLPKMNRMSQTDVNRFDGAADTSPAVGTDWFRAALNSLEGQAVIGLDSAGRIRIWTEAAEALTGYAAGAVADQPYDLLHAAPNGQTPSRTLREAANGRYEASRWWRREDGSLFWARETINPISGTGESGYLLSVLDESLLRAAADQRDAGVVRERAAEDRLGQLHGELRVAEWRAAFLAEASSILVASSLDFSGTVKALARLAVSRLCDWCVVHSLDADGEMRRMETAHSDPRIEAEIQRLPGSSLRMTRSNPLFAVLRTGAGQLLNEPNDAFFEGVSDNDEQAEFLSRLGASTAMIVPLLGRGKVLGTLTLAASQPGRQFDDEELSIAEELARRAAIAIDNARLFREAQEANRAKADFLAIMSHELRTPLNAIMGYSDLLDAEISGPITLKQHRQLARIRASARHLLQLIEEILAFARMEDGGEEVSLEDVGAEQIVREAVAIIEPLAVAKNLGISVDVDSQTVLRTDAGKVRHILVNLLSNAVKFTELGGVSVVLRANSGVLHIEVRDTGIGILPEQIERIFEPFWQGERPTTRRVGGTGLGLSVSRRFARLLGGDITVTSEAGKGTHFHVELPISSVPLPSPRRPND